MGYNPLDRVPKPRCQAEERPTWGLEDIRRFLRTAAASEHQLGPMFALQLLTGLRPGEAVGLQWQDVDLKVGVLHVRRAVVWAGSRWHVQNPKTKAGDRTIALPSLAQALLQQLPKSLPWVFWQNRPPTRKQVSLAMRALCRESGTPKTSAQYLRHAHATLLAAQGLDVKTLQRRLGHARAGLTLDVYAHTLNDGERRAAELLDEALA
jgi:integrase